MDSGHYGNPDLVYCNLTKRLFDPSIEVNYGSVLSRGKQVWFEVIKDDYCGTYNQDTRKIDFNKVNFNVGGSVISKQFIAPINSWYHFITSGTSYFYNSKIKVKTIKRRSRQTDEIFYRGETYTRTHRDSFTTTTFSRYLNAGDKIEIWEYGYKFCQHSPFSFTGYSIPEV